MLEQSDRSHDRSGKAKHNKRFELFCDKGGDLFPIKLREGKDSCYNVVSFSKNPPIEKVIDNIITHLSSRYDLSADEQYINIYYREIKRPSSVTISVEDGIEWTHLSGLTLHKSDQAEETNQTLSLTRDADGTRKCKLGEMEFKINCLKDHDPEDKTVIIDYNLLAAGPQSVKASGWCDWFYGIYLRPKTALRRRNKKHPLSV